MAFPALMVKRLPIVAGAGQSSLKATLSLLQFPLLGSEFTNVQNMSPSQLSKFPPSAGPQDHIPAFSTCHSLGPLQTDPCQPYKERLFLDGWLAFPSKAHIATFFRQSHQGTGHHVSCCLASFLRRYARPGLSTSNTPFPSSCGDFHKSLVGVCPLWNKLLIDF